ncbi:MAG: nuclear transport factor 2 family protein [Amphiplicatus sp.]
MPNNADIVRRCFNAYETKQREAIEPLIAEKFRFSSPYDDGIGRVEYFARCWPNSALTRAIHLEHVVEDRDTVLVLYEFEAASGARFRNMERLTLKDGQITEVEVFFGDPPGGLSKLAWRKRAAELSVE